MNNIRHSSEQPKWGTPLPIIDIAHDTLCAPGLGQQITVDPFSEPEFNEHVHASIILDGSKGNDGFKDKWLGSMMGPRADWILAGMARSTREEGFASVHLATAIVNPPGDDSGDNVKRAWRLLDAYHRLGWLGGGAVWVAFNLNQFQTLQGESERHPLSAHFEGCRCVPDKRLAFTAHSSSGKTGEAPSHPCFFFLLPSLDDVIAAEQRRIFENSASKLGAVF